MTSSPRSSGLQAVSVAVEGHHSRGPGLDMLTGALGFVDCRAHVQLGTVFWLLSGHRQERLAGSVVGQCRRLLRETKAIRTWAEALGRPSEELTAFSFPVLFPRGGTGLRWLGQGGPSRGRRTGPEGRHVGLGFAWPQGGAVGHWAGPAPPGLCFPSSEGIPVLRGARRRKGGGVSLPSNVSPSTTLQTLHLHRCS